MKLYSILGIVMLFSLVSCQSDNSKKPIPKISRDLQKPKVDTPKKTVKKYAPVDDSTNWVDVSFLDPSLVIDMRYATTNNFVHEKMYNCGRCFLRKAVAKALLIAHRKLQTKGYGGLKMFDCYRPRPIQQKLWDKVPNPSYVTPPSRGSMHNRGAAVDLTIVDSAGLELDMGTEFDYFGKEAHHTYRQHSDTIQTNRTLLKTTMESVGFRSIRTEWWHYSFRKKSYALSDMLWDCGDADNTEVQQEDTLKTANESADTSSKAGE